MENFKIQTLDGNTVISTEKITAKWSLDEDTLHYFVNGKIQPSKKFNNIVDACNYLLSIEKKYE